MVVIRGTMGCASLTDLLAEEEIPADLSVVLAAKRKVEEEASSDSTTRRSRTGFDLGVGTAEEICLEIHRFISNLIRKGAVGMEKLVLPVVLTAGGVDLTPSLFLVGTSEYADEDGELWGVLGELRAYNSPNIVKPMPTLFASNTPFFGTDLEDFESHVTGLSSVLPRDFDTTSHQPVLENDEDSRKI